MHIAIEENQTKRELNQFYFNIEVQKAVNKTTNPAEPSYDNIVVIQGLPSKVSNISIRKNVLPRYLYNG